MRDVEDIGLLKMDFLGLRTLTLFDNCVKLIREQLGVEIDLDRMPLTIPRPTSFSRTDRPSAYSSSKAKGCATSSVASSRRSSPT